MASRMVFTVLGAMGVSSGVAQTSSIGAPTPLASSYSSIPNWTPEAGAKVASSERGREDPKQEGESMSEKIGKMAEKSRGTNVDDISPEERRRQEEMPRNPKKRMHEEPIVGGTRDEL